MSDRRFVRDTIIQHLSNADSPLFKDTTLSSQAFVSIDQVQMHLPMKLTGYTDFFSSLVHAERVRIAPLLYHCLPDNLYWYLY